MERILILAVDIDNDLYRKTRITGPVIGRSDNLKAAAKLALADPLDTDSNTMFEAVKKYDELKEQGYNVLVATVTGAEKEGFVADNELARQIDTLLDKFKADSCLLVTDGASDNRALPILKTRVKINSVDFVRMKQAEQFENTYFTIIEKLKEPHYARIIFGIPAILFILFALSYYFNYGWQLPIALIGLYLIQKGFGFEDFLINSFKGLGLSIYRMSFIFYISSIIFFIIALIIGYGSYTYALSTQIYDPLILASYWIEGFLLIFFISVLLFMLGRAIDLESRSMKYKMLAHITYVAYIFVVIILFYIAAAWIIGQIYFSQLIEYSIILLIIGYLISKGSIFFRNKALRKIKLIDKQVINDIGAYIGRISEIDFKKGVMIVKTTYGNTLKYDLDRITNVSDRIIIR
ncbi:MAG: DUF373 family protein [Candidatus Marsarchaeota archaeon]|jgi:putative membrane protein|nr:DUF373 family protein [Candidatus Marsarchaeota archaeon]